MNIDDLISVGAINNIVVSSTIGRNKKLIPAEVIKTIIEGNENVISKYEVPQLHGRNLQSCI